MAGRTNCLLCQQPLPEPRWWERLLSQPPVHDPEGPDGDACWYAFNNLMGNDNPGPRPSKKHGSSW